jgi:amidase
MGALALLVGMGAAPGALGASGSSSGKGRGFQVEEATIADIQTAILRRNVTTTEIVEDYLERIKAYNGTCVNQPEGILGPISTIPHAGKLASRGCVARVRQAARGATRARQRVQPV